MYKSQYYSEKAAPKSNNVTALAITVTVGFLVVFLLFMGLTKLGNACEGATVSDSMKNCISRYGYTFYDFKFLGKTSDEPKDRMNTVYKCSVKGLDGSCSFRNCYSMDAIVKVEVDEGSDVMCELVSIEKN